MDDNKLTSIAEKLAGLLSRNDQKLTVAESCTGGWIAKVLTDLSGSSAWFERGFVTYSNQSKQEMLAVAESILLNHGAVSSQTAEAMATGALQNSHADFSLSVTGIAGPTGGTTKKPVGLVWFAWAVKEQSQNAILDAEKQLFKGNREEVRRQSVAFALNRMIEFVEARFH